jgi:hypothetical protein
VLRGRVGRLGRREDGSMGGDVEVVFLLGNKGRLVVVDEGVGDGFEGAC